MTSTASTTTTGNMDGTESNPIGIEQRPHQQRSKKAKHLGPKLIAIEGLVKRQRTKELQSQLFEFAESCLLMLNKEYFKKEGLAKLKSEVDYIPGSIRIKPVLLSPKELKSDSATIEATSEFNDVIKDCQKKLKVLVRAQATRNLKSLSLIHISEPTRPC